MFFHTGRQKTCAATQLLPNIGKNSKPQGGCPLEFLELRRKVGATQTGRYLWEAEEFRLSGWMSVNW
jgi:hypothetical protein